MAMKRALAITLMLAAAGCVTAPKEVVTLSETIAQQTASLQTAHETLVSRYYAEMRDRVDTFMRDVWIPTFLEKAVNNATTQSSITTTLAAANLNTAAILQKINADNGLSAAEKTAVTNALTKAKLEGRAQFGQVMIFFSEEANRQIGLQRKELLAPINEQEQLVLQKLRESYASLQAEQATMKAFLTSVVSVQQSQDDILRKLNLLETRDDALNKALSLSDKASTALAFAKDGDTGAATFLEELKKLNKELVNTKSEGKDKTNVQ